MDIIDLTPSPATLRLEHFKDWNPEQLRNLLERQARPPRDLAFGPHPNNNNGLRVHGTLQSKLQSHIFHNMPIRVIKLPEMELMERSAVASYLIKTCIKRGAYPTRKEMQDSGIAQWLQGVAKFAILSHTWWQEEEPTYRDFSEQRGRGRKRKKTLRGYEKLHRFCDIAHRKYGVEFAWADTVCIDKASSTELDESIRSMFAWYRNSAVCIAYLGETTDLLDCPSDRWFTRGWTLQEILAPHRLKFYNKDWYPLTNFLNDKIQHFNEERLKSAGWITPNSSFSHQFHLLHHAIFMATGLDMVTICHFEPGIHAPSLPERMKWVARRVTTRAEDRAYCMMGVFGVSISIAYGEGAKRAFFRLFAAILDIGYSRDWFIWGGKSIPWEVHPSRMIPSSPECYLSRDDIGKNDLMSMNARDGEPVALTNLGLPMKMLVVPARVSYDPDPSTFYRPTDIRISCSLSDESVVVQGTAADWDGESQGMMIGPQFALGVLNFVGPEMIDTPKRLYAILLRRPVQESRWTMESRWTYSKWEKWETDQALVFQCSKRFQRMDANRWNAISISRSEVGWSERGDDPKVRLQTLYL